MRYLITLILVLGIAALFAPPSSGDLPDWNNKTNGTINVGVINIGTTNVVGSLAEKAPLSSPALTGTPTINGQSIETQLTNRVLKAGDTMTGTLFIAVTNAITITNAGAAKSYTIGNGDWYASSVPFVRSDVSGTSGILDVLANGTGVDSWIDIGTDYISQSPNGEFIEIRKMNNDYGAISVKPLGSGTARNLVLQRPGTSATGKIGFFWSPTGASEAEQVHGKLDQNSKLSMVMENANTGTGGYVTIEARNGNNDSSYLRIGAMGRGWTTTGGFIANTGILEAGPNITNGLSVMTRHASAPMRFYTAGFADANERLRIDTAGFVGIGTTVPTSTLHISGSLAHSLAVGSVATLGDTNEFYFASVDAQTITLPTAVGHRGRTYTVKTIAPAATATVATTSSQTIDGSATYSLSASNKFVNVIADGTNWWIFGNN